MKKILMLGVILGAFCACNIGDPGADGDAFLKIGWSNEEPSYVDAGGVIPNNFVWDTYYSTEPGTYIIDFEYTYEHLSGKTVVYPYEAEIEVWVEEGEVGRTRGRDGKDADEDVFFDVILYPDGEIDFFHEMELKSEQTGKKEVYSYEERQGNKCIKYIVYSLPVYEKEVLK